MAGRKAWGVPTPPDGQNWIWLTHELQKSPAWNARTLNERRLTDFLMMEHTANGCTENGNLIASYNQLNAAGIRRASISEAVRGLVFLGLLQVKRGGRRGNIGEPSRYRLTFIGVNGQTRATNEWASVDQSMIDDYRKKSRLAKGAHARERIAHLGERNAHGRQQ